MRNVVPLIEWTMARDRVGPSRGNSAPRGLAQRPARADAERNLDALLQAATALFATSGIDVSVRTIAARAGVGVGTVYRCFPRRSGLIAAVLRREIDACADAAAALAAELPPDAALARWMQRYIDLIVSKRGLAGALHSGDPTFGGLAAGFRQRLEPVLRTLLAAAADAGEVRGDIAAADLLGAVAGLCMGADERGPERARRMVALLVDGLRYGARPAGRGAPRE